MGTNGKHTETDKSLHSGGLSSAQLLAVQLLTQGYSDDATAQQIGRTRQTVFGWRHHHQGFQAALNAQRQAVLATATDQCRTLLTAALAVLAEELKHPEHRTRIALELVKMVGLNVADIGSTDAGVLTTEAGTRKERAREGRLMQGQHDREQIELTQAALDEIERRASEANTEEPGNV